MSFTMEILGTLHLDRWTRGQSPHNKFKFFIYSVAYTLSLIKIIHVMSTAPYFTILSPPLPPTLVLSDVRINKKININHDKQLKTLKTYVEVFQDRKSFWIEVAVLDRLHYKNLNQQRPFHRFKRSMELRRLLKRLKSLQIDKELERLYISFWDAKRYLD